MKKKKTRLVEIFSLRFRKVMFSRFSDFSHSTNNKTSDSLTVDGLFMIKTDFYE